LPEFAIVEAPPLERKLVAILAADVAGYSRMMHQDEDATLATLTTHRTVIDDLIIAGRGEISGTAGINVGDVLVKDGTIFGDGVNVASRLEGLAEPGSVCITRGVRDHIRDRGEYEFEDLGEHSVKNIARPVRAFRIMFDPNATTELREVAGAPEAPLSSGVVSEVSQDAIELAFWQSVQASGDTEEYSAYLDRYPEGIFAPLARERLAKPDTLERPASVPENSAVELAFWDTVKESDNPSMFQAYLEQFPSGAFKALAEIRLTELEGADDQDRGDIAAEERHS
jgi:hypothetical protein